MANAVRADARVVDPDGDAGWLSIVLIDRHRAPLFDNPAVSGALRAPLAGPPPDAVSTLDVDSSHFAGAVTVRRRNPDALSTDPFARIAPATLLRIGPGLFGRVRPVRPDAAGSAGCGRFLAPESSGKPGSPGLRRASDASPVKRLAGCQDKGCSPTKTETGST